MDGIFTKLNAKREMVDGRTTITKVTPSTLHSPPSTLKSSSSTPESSTTKTTITKVTILNPTHSTLDPSTLNPELPHPKSALESPESQGWHIYPGREQVNPYFVSSSVTTGETLTTLVTMAFSHNLFVSRRGVATGPIGLHSKTDRP